ncbi:MAG: prepilin-type N-terminal cleavage/methylation domain-containing protein, partial [Alphaproteobacteria bacterium]
MPQRPAGPRGFTLIEMLVALVVLAVGMLGVASLFGISL